MLSAFSTICALVGFASFDLLTPGPSARSPANLYLLAAIFLIAVGALCDQKLLYWRERLRAVWRRQAPYQKMFAGTFAVGVLCHFYRLANFLVSIDDEMGAIRTDPQVWLGQGRWTIFWVERLFFSQPTLPFLPDAVFCLAMTFAYLLLLKSHRIQPGLLPQLLFPLFCAYPVLTVLGEFYANTPSLGLGFLLCAAAATLAEDLPQNPRSSAALLGWALQITCVAASIGCYQSFVLVYAVFGLGALLARGQHTGCPSFGQFLRDFTAVMLQTCAGLLVYQVIQKIHLKWQPSDQSYIESLVNVGQLWQAPGQVLTILFGRMYEIYAGLPSLLGGSIGALKWTLLLGLVSVLLPAKLSPNRRLLAMTLSLAVPLVLLPHAFALLSGGHMPLRTYVAAPYVIWLFVYFATRQRHLALSLLGTTLALVSVFQLIYLNHLYAAEMTLAQQRDRFFAQELYQQLEASKPDFSLSQHYEVDIFGMMPPRHSRYPSDSSSTTGGSFFNWDQGNPIRMLAFMNLLWFSNIHPVDEQRREGLKPFFAAMPCWPSPGSVKWHQDVALIKLSAKPGVLHSRR